MGNSSLVDVKIPAHSSNYTKGRSGRKITKIAIHHMAGMLTVEQCGRIFQKAGRNGSSHYGIGNDGRVGLYVDEENTAWTNSNWNSNCESVTIETANSVIGGNWEVSEKALNKLIKLVADISIRNNIKLVKGKTIVWHSMYIATTCPGPYLLSKMDYIIEQANQIINGQTTADVSPKPAETKPKKIDIKYQVYANGKWLEDVVNYREGADGYAGIYGKAISGLRANTVGKEDDVGKLIYRVHTLNGRWHDEVIDREKDKNGDNYAGILGRAIDGIMIKSTKGKARYRVHLINGSWLPWVTGYNINDSIDGYAGNLGHAIDGIQIEVV